jgi:heat-inducible transcriptional repressor
MQVKKSKKQARRQEVLLGLVEMYLKTGKPVGSQVLGEASFPDLSSATLRNYFAELEAEGYLKQAHVSGGRAPTDLAIRAYADAMAQEEVVVGKEERSAILGATQQEMREMALYLQQATEELSRVCGYPVFVSSPRFDHDLVVDLKLLPIDARRCLCAIVTDFGVIKTLVLQVGQRLSSFSVRRIEAYFHWKLTGQNRPEELSEEEQALAQAWYEEAMVRYLADYTNPIAPDLWITGVARLLQYPEFQSAAALVNSLALFEAPNSLHELIRQCCQKQTLSYWIGSQLQEVCPLVSECAAVAVPYRLHQTVVGAVGLLGSMRMPYGRCFGLLELFAQSLSDAMTRNLYKFKVAYRQPYEQRVAVPETQRILLDHKRTIEESHV